MAWQRMLAPSQKTVPGPRGSPLLGVLPHLWQNPLRCLTEAAHRYGDIVSLPLGFQRVYLLNHPDHIKHVLQDKPHQYHKSAWVSRIKPLFGEGLSTSEGPLWQRQRRMMLPAFQHQRIVALAAVVTDATAVMLERWQPIATRGQPLEIMAAMRDLTQEIIGRILFGDDRCDKGLVIGRALTTALDFINYRVWNVIALPLCLPTSRHRQFRRALRRLDSCVYHLIDERYRTGHRTEDLLSVLLRARDEATGKPMSRTQLRDEVMTLLIAGHMTATAALAWIWYLLSLHPEVERNLQAELAAVLGGRALTAQDLPLLPYTRMIIEEGMRLYPPTWATARTPLVDDEIGGYRIPAHSIILLSPYVLHRHPAFWEHPERFDPERFSQAQSDARPRFAYFPFGGGRRLCIGQSLAMMELRLILAMVAQSYRLRLVPGTPVEPQPLVSLQPPDGLLMTLHPQSRE